MKKIIAYLIFIFSVNAVFANDVIIQELFANRKSDVQITGQGIVVRLLPDDLEGSRHQKFILRLGSGQTLLISHNIDIAPRISTIQESDVVRFNGEYEWNAKGGVVHWTHRDPKGDHEHGWLIHNGRKYD